MANYRSLHVKLWGDPVMESLTPLSKLLFIYLLTNAHRNESCLYQISIKKMSDESGLKPAEVEKCLAELRSAGRVLYEAESFTVWVINAVKHQAMNANCIKSIRHDLERCNSRALIEGFCNHYQTFGDLSPVCYDFIDLLQTHPDGLPNPSYRVQGTDTGREKGGVGEKDPPGDPPADPPKPTAKQLNTLAEQIYDAYPLKVGRPKAVEAILKAMRDHSPEYLLERTREYSRIRDGDMEFVPHPATWFNQKRYENDPSTWVRSSNGNGKNGHALPYGLMSMEEIRKLNEQTRGYMAQCEIYVLQDGRLAGRKKSKTNEPIPETYYQEKKQ